MNSKIPDAINNSVSKNFTQVPNALLRNPDVSAKAKTILCILLSNRDGWHSYFTSIGKMLKEGETALRSALQELEQAGYLKRLRYRDAATKQYRGTFWSYTDTPHEHCLDDALRMLDAEGLEIDGEKATSGKPTYGFSSPNNTKEKNTKKEKLINYEKQPSSKNELVEDTTTHKKKFRRMDEISPSKPLNEEATVEDFMACLPEACLPDGPDWRLSPELAHELDAFIKCWPPLVKNGTPLRKSKVSDLVRYLRIRSENDLQKAIEVIQYSVRSNYAGFYAPPIEKLDTTTTKPDDKPSKDVPFDVDRDKYDKVKVRREVASTEEESPRIRRRAPEVSTASKRPDDKEYGKTGLYTQDHVDYASELDDSDFI